MNKNNQPIRLLLLLGVCSSLFLSACSSVDSEAVYVEPTPLQPKSDTAVARKSLAHLYLSKAAGQLDNIDDAVTRREARLMIAHTCALLGDRETGRRIMPSLPPLPESDSEFDAYLHYLTILAAVGDYSQIEASIEQLDNPRLETLIRGFVVYYDAILRSPHLKQSLEKAADRMSGKTTSHALYYLALGYQLSGQPAKARKTCLLSNDPAVQFWTCSYMAATLSAYQETGEAAFYLERADQVRASIANDAGLKPQALMMYGRALALAQRFEEAQRMYSGLYGQTEAFHVGSAIGRALRSAGRLEEVKRLVREMKSHFVSMAENTDHIEDLYDSYGDFLIALEQFYDYDKILKQTPDAELKIHFLIGGAHALADELIYGQ